MIFPITELLSDEASSVWIEKPFHPQGLRCPNCGAGKPQARLFRQQQRGTLDYRCRECGTVFKLDQGTLFSGSNLRPRQAVWLLRGVGKGESASRLAQALGLARQSVPTWRQRLQANGDRLVAETPWKDRRTETEEMFQTAGENRRQAQRPSGSAPTARH